jgi:hypothetical protein
MAKQLDNIKFGQVFYEQCQVSGDVGLDAIAKAYLVAHGNPRPSQVQIRAQSNLYKRYKLDKYHKAVSPKEVVAIDNINVIWPGEVLLLPYTPGVVSDFDGKLKVTASDGVNIKDKADYKGNILVSDKNSKGMTYKYKKSSITKKDSTGRVWVEVLLDEARHSTGWLPVSGPSVLRNPNSPTENWVTFI